MGASTPMGTAVFSTCTSSFSLRNWSAKWGHVIMGTPALTPSNAEFHPQCVTKPPMAGCDKIRACGAHPVITSPLPLVLPSNPDSHVSVAGVLSLSLITQMNGLPDSSRPSPISFSCEGCVWVRLPKLTYTTDRGCMESNQTMHPSPSTDAWLPLTALLALSLLPRQKGPMAQTFFPVASRYLSMYDGSRSSKLLSTSPSAVSSASTDCA
ncbi:unnamed protein product [Musa hybrid cultivar]